MAIWKDIRETLSGSLIAPRSSRGPYVCLWQRPGEIIKNVVDLFKPDRKPDQPVADAVAGALLSPGTRGDRPRHLRPGRPYRTALPDPRGYSTLASVLSSAPSFVFCFLGGVLVSWF